MKRHEVQVLRRAGVAQEQVAKLTGVSVRAVRMIESEEAVVTPDDEAERERRGIGRYGDDAANVLYHVVNERHLRRRPMIFTTNKSLDAWGQVFHDRDLAHAIVDRILERGRLLKLDGPSLRTKHLGLDDPTDDASTEPARVSGIQRQEFPEPAG